MYDNKKILAIIPARAGSKGLPSKNSKVLNGKPLIAWTIEASLKSKYIDETIMSTDCEQIAAIAKKYGAQVPFLRPQELAQDDSRSIDAVYHTLEELEKIKVKYDVVVFMQPTSPLRTEKHIDEALEILFKKEAKGIVSMCKCEKSPVWSNMIPEDGSIKDFIKNEFNNISRQQTPDYYRINGAIYIAYIDYLRENDAYFGDKSYVYKMDSDSSTDIDTIRDFQLAEIIMRERHEQTRN